MQISESNKTIPIKSTTSLINQNIDVEERCNESLQLIQFCNDIISFCFEWDRITWIYL